MLIRLESGLKSPLGVVASEAWQSLCLPCPISIAGIMVPLPLPLQQLKGDVTGGGETTGSKLQ